MVLYPEVYKKAQAEVDRVVGQDRLAAFGVGPGHRPGVGTNAGFGGARAEDVRNHIVDLGDALQNVPGLP